MENGFEDEELRFLNNDDELFRDHQPDWYYNAWVKSYGNQFGTYADGYIEAARAQIERCLNEQRGLDILVFPVVFLYRHYIELRLKELIVATNYCDNGSKDFPKTHNIVSLWNTFVKLYTTIGEEVDNNFVNAERVIKEFASVDPASMAFRYPIDNQGNDSLSMTLINLRNFAEVMERLHNFLDALSCQLDHYVDLKEEMYSDLYSEIYRDY